MKKRVLGTRIRWKEEKGVPKIRIGGVRDGGIVDIWIEPADPTLVEMPETIVAVYTISGTIPEHVGVTPDSLLGSGGLTGKVACPPGGGAVTCKVDGVKPGNVYDVQLIYEFADDGVPPTNVPPSADSFSTVGQGTLTIPQGP